jgi:regulator of sirC expression with transglutaminase-like and TPR domain
MRPGEGFDRLASAPEGTVRLAEAALWIAADEYPGLDVASWLERLDELGDRAARAVRPGMDVAAATDVLSALLFDEEGLRGNADDYYDPRNSFLNDVLARRLGIPITLSVVYIDVGARAGLTVRGIGLPGHFVVRAERQGDARLLDPFEGGRPLTPADCEALVQRVQADRTPFDPAWLLPVTTREVVTRMLGNLRGIYTTRGDWPRTLRTLDRMLAVAPEVPGLLRDRGTTHVRLGNGRAAVRDWEAYLTSSPTPADAERVRQELRALRQAMAVLN